MALILFLGGVHSDIPLLECLKNSGHSVLLLNNAPVADVNLFCDVYLSIDYSDKETVLETAREHAVDHIIPGCNDSAYLTCAYVAEQLGLPGYDSYDVAEMLHHKDLFRNFMRENGFSRQKFFNLTDTASQQEFDGDGFKYPLIIKPVDRSGGKGISKVDNLNGVEGALIKAFEWSLNGHVIIEEFEAGALKSFSGFLVDGGMAFHFFDNEYSLYNPYQVSSSLAPLEIEDGLRDSLVEEISAIAKRMGLVGGLLHTQFLMVGDNFHIVEITRRTPGDLYAYPVNKLTGVDYTSLTVSGYMGESLHIDDWQVKDGYTVRHCPAAKKNGVISQYVIDSSIEKYIIKVIKYLDVGDEVVNYSFQRMGVFILSFTDKEVATDILRRINELIFVTVGD